MASQDHQDKLVCQDPKVTEVCVVQLVPLVLLESVHLDLLDLMESQDRRASLDFQGAEAQKV